jgi:hypothetical protein
MLKSKENRVEVKLKMKNCKKAQMNEQDIVTKCAIVTKAPSLVHDMLSQYLNIFWK